MLEAVQQEHSKQGIDDPLQDGVIAGKGTCGSKTPLALPQQDVVGYTVHQLE